MNKFMRLGQVWAVKAHLGFWDENIFASMPPCRKQQQVDLTWTSTFPPASNASRWPGSNPGGTSATTNTGPVFELVLCTWEKNTILVVKEWNWNMKKRSKKEDKVPLPLAHGGIAVLDPIKLRLLSPTKAKVVQLWWAMGQRFLAKHHQTWNSKNWILKMVLSLWFPMYSWIWPLLSARGGRSVLLRSPKRSTCPGSWSPICQWPGAGEQFAKPWASEITVDFLIWFSSEKIQSEGLTREKWWHVSRCQGSISGTSRSWALLPHMGRSTNSFSKLDVKIKPTQKNTQYQIETYPNHPKSGLSSFHKISYMSLGKIYAIQRGIGLPWVQETSHALQLMGILGGTMSTHKKCSAMVQKKLGMIGAWYILIYGLILVDICWHMLTHTIPEVAGSTTAWLSRCQAAQTVMRPSAPPLQMYLPGSNGATWELLTSWTL